MTVVLGTSTTQPGEPALIPGPPHPIKRTVWYAFRPTKTGRVRVSFGGGYFLPYAVFTGSALTNLTRVTNSDAYGELVAPFDVAAGQTYWIALGSSSLLPLFNPIELKLQPVNG